MKPITKKINTGVIGVGYLGRFHAQKYAQLPNSNLTGVVDFDYTRAQTVAAECQTKAYSSYQELVDDVDAVSIVTPTPRHYEIAQFFLSQGKHVLIEKPITVEIQHARELIELANKNNVLLQVGHLERFNNALKIAHPLINNPWFIEATRLAPFKTRGSDVSVILDLMIHDLDLIFSLVPSPLKKITAHGASLITDFIDVAKVHLEFNNGCCANLTASRACHKTERRLEIFQKDMILNLDLDQKTLQIQTQNGHEQKTTEKGDALLDEIDAFLNSISEKKAAVVDGEAGLLALEVAVKIEQLILAKNND